MEKITVLDDYAAYIGDNPEHFDTDHAIDKYACCGLYGYYADIYYDIDAKKPSDAMIKLATKRVIKARLRKMKNKKPGSLDFFLSFYKDKEYGKKCYYSRLAECDKAIQADEALLERCGK